MKKSIYTLPKLRTYKGDSEFTERTVIRNIPDSKYKNHNKILDYLKSGVCISAMAHVDYDAITHERIPYEAVTYTDGTYRWTSELIYYVEKYGLLPEEQFIEHALKEGTVKITESDLL